MEIPSLLQFFSALSSSFAEWGLLGLRLAWGVALIGHGWLKIKHPIHWMDIEARKHSGFPGYLQAIAAFIIFAGGIAIVAGFLTPLAASAIAGVMETALGLYLLNGLPFIKAIPDAPGDSISIVGLLGDRAPVFIHWSR